MRKLLITLLLAGAAATPALADPGDHHDHDSARAEHQQMRQERQESRSSVERPQFNGRGNFNGMNNGSNAAIQQNFVRQQRFQQNVVQQQNVDAQREAFREQRERFRGQHGFQGQVVDQSLRQGDRPVPNVLRERNRSPMVGDANRHDRIAWNRDWRNDRRYDWRNYRHHHRSRFHLGIYYDPFGYGYQPFGIGYSLMPAYYSQQYWFDPEMYGLPFPPPGTEWVRYWNDALLVDVYTGQVIDVIHDFFW